MLIIFVNICFIFYLNLCFFIVGLLSLEKCLQPSTANCFFQPQKLERSIWVSHGRSIFSCFTPKAASVEGNTPYLIQTKTQEGRNFLLLLYYKNPTFAVLFFSSQRDFLSWEYWAGSMIISLLSTYMEWL